MVLLKPDAVQRNLMGDIICKFEERGFKLAAMKFVSASEDLLKAHYADLSKKPFFPELVRYMRSGPIVAMVWTGLNIVPMVRAMVGATKPSEAAPGTIRGDLCIDVGRNLIHASDSNESSANEVAMWFPEIEIVQWRPCSLEWTYEDEVIEDSHCSVISSAHYLVGKNSKFFRQTEFSSSRCRFKPHNKDTTIFSTKKIDDFAVEDHQILIQDIFYILRFIFLPIFHGLYFFVCAVCPLCLYHLVLRLSNLGQQISKSKLLNI